MSARDRILRRLRSTSVRLPQAPPTPSPGPVSATLDDCLTRFTAEAAALGVDCHIEASPDDVRRRVAGIVDGRSVLSWDRQWLPYSAADVYTTALFADAPAVQQATAAVGVTGCDAAVAETGSLVLFSGPGRARTVSLLPPLHLAIVERSRLCFSLAEVFSRHHERLRGAASCTVITGPSRTADIELTLTLGIHGPGRVIVIVGP
jgi:L-lactate dehydrogenase complex protein LldG